MKGLTVIPTTLSQYWQDRYWYQFCPVQFMKWFWGALGYMCCLVKNVIIQIEGHVIHHYHDHFLMLTLTFPAWPKLITFRHAKCRGKASNVWFSMWTVHKSGVPFMRSCWLSNGFLHRVIISSCFTGPISPWIMKLNLWTDGGWLIDQGRSLWQHATWAPLGHY